MQREDKLIAEKGGIPVKQVEGPMQEPKQFLKPRALGNVLIIINLTLLAIFIFIQIFISYKPHSIIKSI